MATLQQLEEALINADAAGDTEAATQLAEAISNMRGTSPQSKAVSTKEKVLGFPLTRLAMGAVSPVAGAAQLASHALGGGESIDEFLKNIEKEKQSGMQYWGEKTGLPIGPGTDWMGILGSTLPFLPAATAAKSASTLSQLARASGLGGVAGATSPVTEGEFLPEKAGQTAIGALGGVAVPSLGIGYQKAAQGVSKLGSKMNPETALTEYQRKIIGEPNVGKIVETIEGYKPPIPGVKPTVAEIVKEVPEGSPLVAHQRAVATSPGGPSSQFGKRLLENEGARNSAWKALEQETDPMRENALRMIDEQGGISIPSLQQAIHDLSQQPGIRASKMGKKALDQVRDDIAALAGNNLKIDARDLYEIRKQIANIIQRSSVETADHDKKLSKSLLKDIRQMIDARMDKASGNQWGQYLDTYSKGARAISESKDLAKKMYRAPQPTSIRVKTEPEKSSVMGHALPKSVHFINEIMKHLGKDIRPQMQAEAAERYLHPERLAAALKQTPKESIVQSPSFRNFLGQSGILSSQASVKKQ